MTFLLAREGQHSPAAVALEGEPLLEGVPAHRPAADGGEQRVVGCPGVFGEPGPQGGDRARAQRRDPVFAAFAVAGDVGAAAEVDIPAGQGGELGGPQPGLDREQHPGVVTAAGPGCPVWGGKQGLGLGGGKERDDRLVSPLGRDRQDTFDVSGVLGVAQGGEAEQGVDRGQSGVAAADGVAPLALDVVEERADHWRVQVGEVEPARHGAGALRGEVKEQPDGVAVGGDRVRAGPPLADQPLGEKRLHGAGGRRHRGAPGAASLRAASASSSGEALRYQYVCSGDAWPR